MGYRVREDGSGETRRDGGLCAESPVCAESPAGAESPACSEEIASAEEISCAEEIAGAMAITSVGVSISVYLCGEHLLRMWHLLRKTNGYHYTIIGSTKRFDTYGGNAPENVVPST